MTEFYIHSVCHEHDPPWVKISDDGKTLTFVCSVCKEKVTEMKIEEHVHD